ncbi:hypothetical protein E2542_SST06700 [Spatholobus suberectus]|nr:hypothetical protein E2542_SST06700 [Spatholobus suberectus]
MELRYLFRAKREDRAPLTRSAERSMVSIQELPRTGTAIDSPYHQKCAGLFDILRLGLVSALPTGIRVRTHAYAGRRVGCGEMCFGLPQSGSPWPMVARCSAPA